MTQTNKQQNVSLMQRCNMPSTSKVGSDINIVTNKPLRSSLYITQKQEVEKSKDIGNIVSVDYNEFENKLMNRQVSNSTFKLEEGVVFSGNIIRHNFLYNVEVCMSVNNL